MKKLWTPKLIMQAIITISILGIAGYGILFSKDENTIKWSMGILGVIIGYWIPNNSTKEK